MNLNELKEFLLKFQIEESKVEDILKEKIIFEKLEHLYLIDKNLKLEKNQFPKSNTLVFIKLKEGLLPSSYLYQLIKENISSDLIANPSSAKQANNFVFGKNFSFDGIPNVRMMQHKFYLVEHEGKILGYVTLNKKDKKTPIRNEYHIGEFLKE